MKLTLTFHVPVGEFDAAEFPSDARIMRRPGKAIVLVQEVGELFAGGFTDSDGGEVDLLELIHSTHFVRLEVGDKQDHTTIIKDMLAAMEKAR